MIPHRNLNELISLRQALTQTQKRGFLHAIQTGYDFPIGMTKRQEGSGLGTILASIGIPVILTALTGQGTCGSAPRMGLYRPPPPNMGHWPMTGGRTKKRVDEVSCSSKTAYSRAYYWSEPSCRASTTVPSGPAHEQSRPYPMGSILRDSNKGRLRERQKSPV